MSNYRGARPFVRRPFRPAFRGRFQSGFRPRGRSSGGASYHNDRSHRRSSSSERYRHRSGSRDNRSSPDRDTGSRHRSRSRSRSLERRRLERHSRRRSSDRDRDRRSSDRDRRNRSRSRSSSSLKSVSQSPESVSSARRRNSLSPGGSTAATGSTTKDKDGQDRRATPSPTVSKESLRITVDNDHFESRRHLWKPIGASPERPVERPSPIAASNLHADHQDRGDESAIAGRELPSGHVVAPGHPIDWQQLGDIFTPNQSIQNDLAYADAEMGRNRSGRDSYRDGARDRQWSGASGPDKHVSSIVPLSQVREAEHVWKIPKVLNERDMDAFDDDVNCDRFAKRMDTPEVVKPVKLEPKMEPKDVNYDMFDDRASQQPQIPRTSQQLQSLHRAQASYYEQERGRPQTPPQLQRSSTASQQLPGLGFDVDVPPRHLEPPSFLRGPGQTKSPDRRRSSTEFTIPGLGDDMDVEDEDKFLYGDGDEEGEAYNASKSIPGLGGFTSPPPSATKRPLAKAPPPDPRLARDLGNILHHFGLQGQGQAVAIAADQRRGTPQLSVPSVVSTITDLYQRIHDGGGGAVPSRTVQDPRLQAMKETSDPSARAQARLHQQEPASSSSSSGDPRRPASSASEDVIVDPRSHHRVVAIASPMPADPRSVVAAATTAAAATYESLDPRTARRESVESRGPPVYDQSPARQRPRQDSLDDSEYRSTPDYKSRDPRVAALHQYQQQQQSNVAPVASAIEQMTAQGSPLRYADYPPTYPPPSLLGTVPPSPSTGHQSYPYPAPAAHPNYYVAPPPSAEVSPTPPIPGAVGSPSTPNYGGAPPSILYRQYPQPQLAAQGSRLSEYATQVRASNLRVIVPTSAPEPYGPAAPPPFPGTVSSASASSNSTMSSSTSASASMASARPLIDGESVRIPANLDERTQLKTELTQAQNKVQMWTVELDRLRRLQGELMRKKQKQKDGHNDPQVVKNNHLQETHEKQISSAKRTIGAIERALKASEGLKTIGSSSSSRHPSLSSPPAPQSSSYRRSHSTDDRNRKESSSEESSQRKQFRFVDSTDNWCKHCGEVFKVATDLLKHLHSKHADVMENEAPGDRPWAKESKEPNSSAAGATIVVFQGIEFLVPCAAAFFCELCKEFTGDVIAARIHMESERHNAIFQRYVKSNPGYPRRLSMERQASAAKLREDSKRRADAVLRETLQAKKRRIEAALAEKESDKEKGGGRGRHSPSDMEMSDGEEGALRDPSLPSRHIRLNLLSSDKSVDTDDESAKSSKIAIKLRKNKEPPKATSVYGSSSSSTSSASAAATTAANDQRTQRILSNLYKSKKIKKEKVGDTRAQVQVPAATAPANVPQEALPTSPPASRQQPVPQPAAAAKPSTAIVEMRHQQRSNVAPTMSLRPRPIITCEERELLPPGVDHVSNIALPSPSRPPLLETPAKPPASSPRPAAVEAKQSPKGSMDVVDKGTLLQVKIKQEPKSPEKKDRPQTKNKKKVEALFMEDFNFDGQDVSKVLDSIPLPEGLDDALGDEFMLDAELIPQLQDNFGIERKEAADKNSNAKSDEVVEADAPVASPVEVDSNKAQVPEVEKTKDEAKAKKTDEPTKDCQGTAQLEDEKKESNEQVVTVVDLKTNLEANLETDASDCSGVIMGVVEAVSMSVDPHPEEIPKDISNAPDVDFAVLINDDVVAENAKSGQPLENSNVVSSTSQNQSMDVVEEQPVDSSLVAQSYLENLSESELLGTSDGDTSIITDSHEPVTESERNLLDENEDNLAAVVPSASAYTTTEKDEDRCHSVIEILDDSTADGEDGADSISTKIGKKLADDSDYAQPVLALGSEPTESGEPMIGKGNDDMKAQEDDEVLEIDEKPDIRLLDRVIQEASTSAARPAASAGKSKGTAKCSRGRGSPRGRPRGRGRGRPRGAGARGAASTPSRSRGRGKKKLPSEESEEEDDEDLPRNLKLEIRSSEDDVGDDDDGDDDSDEMPLAGLLLGHHGNDEDAKETADRSDAHQTD